MTTHNHGRVSPFGHPRINAHQATPRGLTQPITSFIGLAYPGIHHAPKKQKTQTFFTHRQQKIPRTKPQKRKNKQQQHNYRCYFYRIRVHYTVLTQHTTPHTTPNNQQSGILLQSRGDFIEQQPCCSRYPTACHKTKQTITNQTQTHLLLCKTLYNQQGLKDRKKFLFHQLPKPHT